MLQLIAAPAALRTFKTTWFAKAAKRHGISDQELCHAVREVQRGRATDLGGGVWKKRLNDNLDRAIVLAKGRQNWFFVYLFAKKDSANIGSADLVKFKELAEQYASLSAHDLSAMLKEGRFLEICHAIDS